VSKYLTVIPLVLLLCLVFGCQKGEEVAEEPETEVTLDIADIQKFNDDWDVACNAEDIDKVLAFFADDAVRIPAAEPALRGKEAIRNWLQQLFDRSDVEQKNIVEDFRVSDNLAFFWGTWVTTNTPKAGGEPLQLNGSYVSIIEKQADGTWKTIFNSWSNEKLIKSWPEFQR
jgi:uncharacterized protein (TIGR02246 family)